MKVAAKIFSVALLLFNAIGALYGGGSLILRPDGSGIQLSPHWLVHTPFHNYLIPGIILFLFNGLFSLYVLTVVFRNKTRYYFLVSLQGSILVGWIVIQILMIRTIYFLHFLMGVVGLALLMLGFYLVDIASIRERKSIF